MIPPTHTLSQVLTEPGGWTVYGGDMGKFGRIAAATAMMVVVGAPGAAFGQTPSPSPSPSATSSPSPSPAASPSPTPSTSPSPQPSPTPSPSPAPGAPEVSVTFRPGATLAQIGHRFTYRMTVTNTGTVPLTGLEVHQIVPAELNVAGVPILDEVDYTQLGRVGGVNEDILWGIKSLPPGQAVTLSWFAVVDRAGDHLATGSVTATADGLEENLAPPPVYVAAAEVLGVVVDGEQTVTKTVTQRRPVTGTGALGAPGAILPATGTADAAGFAGLGLVLIVIGSLMWRTRGRKVGVHALVVAALLLGACTNGGDEIEPQVKGNRIENTTPGDTTPEGTDGSDDGSDDDDSAENDQAGDTGDAEPNAGDQGGGPDLAAPDGATAPVEFVTEEVVVEVPVSELDSTTLGPTSSDNSIALEWASGLVAANSGLSSSPDAVATLRTTLAASGDQVVVNVTLENLLEDERLVVKGRFLHEIAGLPGGTVTLGSDPVDLTLAPGAVTKQRFTYKLPDGSYTLGARFAPSS